MWSKRVQANVAFGQPMVARESDMGSINHSSLRSKPNWE